MAETPKIPPAGTPGDHPTALPAPVSPSLALDQLVESARDYARHATAGNTNKAYASDWAQFTAWCRSRGASPLPPSPHLVGLYIADLAALQGNTPALSVASIERRLSGLVWTYAQRGTPLDRRDRHIASVLAGIRRKHAKPPAQKAAVLAGDLRAMLATLPRDLRGARDRAMLLIGFAGGLRRSELVGLDHGRDDTIDSAGWVQVLEDGLVLTLRGKTGWREVEIARGSAPETCPATALSLWLKAAQIDFGPLFTSVSRDGLRSTGARLSDKHVARLAKSCAEAAGLDPRQYSGHSLRAGLATSAEVDERYVQKQLGHASAEMTRRYQRNRDRFRVNLTKAAGL